MRERFLIIKLHSMTQMLNDNPQHIQPM